MGSRLPLPKPSSSNHLRNGHFGGSGIGKHVSRAFCNANHLRLTCINCNVSSFSAFQKTLISAAKQGDVIELDEFNAFPEDTQNHIMHLFEQFRTLVVSYFNV